MTDPTKATRAKIAIGDIEVDGFRLPDGSYRMSQRQIAEIVDLPRQSASRFLESKAIKTLLGEDYASHGFEKIPIDSGMTRINAIPLEVVAAYWVWQSSKGNKKAMALNMAMVSESLQRRFDNAFGVSRSEDEYNRQLAEKVRSLETDLKKLGEAYAMEDEIRWERDRFERLLRENNIDPYGLPDSHLE